jgi:glycosyltransferase involved in cell wall biosynthesis
MTPESPKVPEPATMAPHSGRACSHVGVLIIAKDEEKNLPYSLASVVEWADVVHVVDSGSIDRTVAIAESFGARVTRQPWLGYARQKNFALESLNWDCRWIFILDADEVILPDLREELLAIASRPLDDTPEAGFHVNRYFIFLGKRIRHCGYYPSWNMRFFKRGRARYEEREVHEHMVADGPLGYLKGHMEHHDRRGLEIYMAKHNRYSTLEAREIVKVMLASGSKAGLDARLLGNSLERRRWIKHYLYPRLPAKWVFRFFYMYILKLGVLDGLAGLRFCLFISAYELLIGLKIAEQLQEANQTPPTATPRPVTPPPRAS